VRFGREDESDGNLYWFGARAMGAIDRGSRGLFGYWLDTGFVYGRERLTEFEDGENGNSVVQDVSEHDVSGWAIDAGVDWFLPLRFEPRLYAGYAFGSGSSANDGSKTDHSYQQSDLQSNEAGLGGAERFSLYGVLLDPELSNLGILTLGAGVTLFANSSLDLVYHHYQLAERADSLRGARLETELSVAHRTLGDEFDLVVAIEEWERLEFEFAATAFRAGRAFGAQSGDWSWGGFLALRLAF
jgi:hypothetical protein